MSIQCSFTISRFIPLDSHCFWPTSNTSRCPYASFLHAFWEDSGSSLHGIANQFGDQCLPPTKQHKLRGVSFHYVLHWMPSYPPSVCLWCFPNSLLVTLYQFLATRASHPLLLRNCPTIPLLNNLPVWWRLLFHFKFRINISYNVSQRYSERTEQTLSPEIN